MKSDNEDREGLVPETSNMSPEEKMADTRSSSDDFTGDMSQCSEDWENADIKPSQEASRKKLCGYLHKCSSKAPIKTWKSRWFCYDENKCYLLYYRTAQDITPLGSIEISIATFDLKVGADEGIFEIRTPIKDFILKAVNKQAMMYWLQQLQLKRWEFCNKQAKGLVEAMPSFPFINEAQQSNSEAEQDFLPLVTTPTDIVGIKAASLPAPPTSIALQNISLKHPWIEIQNTVHNLCGSRQNRKDSSGFEENFEIVADEDHLKGETEDTVMAEMQKDTKMRLKPPTFRKYKKANSSFRYFVEGAEQGKTASLQHQVLILTEEVKSQKELVKLLHKALEAAQKEKRESCRYLVTATEKDRLELVRHKVRQIAELSKQVQVLEMEKKDLEQEAALKEEHIKELGEHVQLLMDKNEAKQQVILKLTDQLTREMSDSVTEADSIMAETLYKQQEKIEHLKDDLEAYKTQNQFLNSEVHQVSKIWSTVAQREKNLLMKCAQLQAHNCQIESKYLMFLRTLQGLPDLAQEHMALVTGLIEEALQWDMKEDTLVPVQLSPVNQYDDYGFMTVPEYEAADRKLLAKIQALEIKYTNLNKETTDKPLSERWNNFGELTPSSELKSLLRCGVPIVHRQRVWRWIISHQLKQTRSAGHYHNLLKKCENAEHPASQQIELDLHRTLPNNKHFMSPASQFIPKLRRVLLAFSWQNPTIGYCQGLNRLAAIALLVLEEEEEAFWCLVHITNNLMPQDYYSNTLIGSQVDQRVFKDILAEKLPRLTAHLNQLQIDLSLVTFNWFLVVFVDSLVSDILLRVWDAFLYEGAKVIFRYALAIFKYNEEAILKIRDNLEFYQYLRFFTKTICDGRKLMSIAFSDMNPFPMKLLQNRRGVHRLKVEAELRELEQLKAEYMKEQAEHAASPLDGAASEEEEEI
ncbi:TBC1 domain family member 2A [Crotalus tigris]|uniref:TBC1 domain family member 2A n=1 Tax=Crotalus tigris TaxID=88082 RepID=UPI00192F805B|nr:TBC1 domain family member 2A [Crotalus tigris]XP_039189616.1 TBC1 domain family member 2A [Crotalus tigris]XP_039189617.1 TBC1 domain family member 2A [Crotalus tigris]XP_039189618.1 TBC1 domain family member 2A [Crotalus tigris]